MPRYLALSDGYLGRKPGYVTKGTEFDYDGKPGKWMKPIRPAAGGPAAPSVAPPRNLTAAEKAEAKRLAKEEEKAAAKGGAPPGDAPKGSGDKEVL